MAKKATAVASVEITDDLLAAYEAAEAKVKARHVEHGKNVPYDDVIGIIKLVLPKIREAGKDISVSALKDLVTEQLQKRYDALPEGMDRETIHVGRELVTMTRTEIKELRQAQLRNSRKNNMVYRYIYGYTRK